MQRVTITVPDEVMERVRRRVAAGGSPSVSAFVAGAVADAVRGDDLLDHLDALDAELGRPSAEDREWAQRIVDRVR